MGASAAFWPADICPQVTDCLLLLLSAPWVHVLCHGLHLRTDAMLVWGWRVPFLLAIVTLVAAIVLRYNMPESQEVRRVQQDCAWTDCMVVMLATQVLDTLQITDA